MKETTKSRLEKDDPSSRNFGALFPNAGQWGRLQQSYIKNIAVRKTCNFRALVPYNSDQYMSESPVETFVSFQFFFSLCREFGGGGGIKGAIVVIHGRRAANGTVKMRKKRAKIEGHQASRRDSHVRLYYVRVITYKNGGEEIFLQCVLNYKGCKN